MGQIKQLHIDCTPDHCQARGYEETCYAAELMGDAEPVEAGTHDGGDFDANMDIDRE